MLSNNVCCYTTKPALTLLDRPEEMLYTSLLQPDIFSVSARIYQSLNFLRRPESRLTFAMCSVIASRGVSAAATAIIANSAVRRYLSETLQVENLSDDLNETETLARYSPGDIEPASSR